MKHLLPLSLSLLLTVTLNAHADSIERATPESQGVSSAGLLAMSEWVRSESFDVRSMIVLRNGKLILEWYAGDVSPDMNHNVFSVTKSVVSAIAGIAVADRRLAGLDTTVGEVLDLSPALKQINLEQLLTMRSGLPQSRASKPTGPERELFDRITAAPDRLREISSLEPVHPTGTTFAYTNIDPQLVSAMIEAACDKTVLDVAQRTLFDPLGFQGARW